MNQLDEMLDVAVSQATFDVGNIEMPREGISITYTRRPEECVTPQELRDMLESKGAGGGGEYEKASRADLSIPQETLSSLEAQVRALLVDYIDPESDRIGHAFPTGGSRESQHGYSGYVSHGSRSIEVWTSPVESFARALVKGAAVLGPGAIGSQLDRWLHKGEPIRYRQAAILNGIAVRDQLVPTAGINIEPLPFTLDEIPIHFPRSHTSANEKYLGRAVVYIDYVASPALFNPTMVNPGPPVIVKRVSDVSFETVCQALSLACNHYVNTGFYWGYYDVVPGLSRANSGTTIAYGTQRFGPWPAFSGVLTSERFEEVNMLTTAYGHSGLELSETKLGDTIESIRNLNSDSSLTALSRWIKSKDDSQDVKDSLIDLRIALESLYLKDFQNDRYRGEMRFRLALYGAWHLGEDFVDRKIIRKKLLDAYDEASSIVHGSSVDDTVKRRRLLIEGQDLCRRGIQKLLEEDPSNLADLILGAGYEK